MIEKGIGELDKSGRGLELDIQGPHRLIFRAF